MGIEDIQISEELETNAPSIKYSGNEGPKSPQEQQQMMMAQLEEEYLKYVEDMLEQGMEPMSLQQFMEQAIAEGQMSGGNPLPQDPTKPVNPFAPKPTGPTLPDRQMAAYGGIMGLDGRKKYGIGSWFQENIMDPIKENPMLAATAAYLGYDTYKNRDDFDESLLGKGIDQITKTRTRKDSKGKEQDYTIGGDVANLIGKNIIPIAGGLASGLFTKNQQGGQSGMPSDNTALQLADLKKTANLLDQKQGLAAGLNFLPSVAARKFTPTEMVETYSQAAANGGRIGFNMGGGADMGAPTLEAKEMFMQSNSGINYFQTVMESLYQQNQNKYQSPEDPQLVQDALMVVQKSFANGGRINKAEGGIMDLGGMEKDYRAEGGFVPIGREEKADDVPARLSVNEFVFTADAVRNAGGGDIDQGAKVMENMMKHLEAGGQVSEESQGLGGAREMFETSERLSEVI